MRGKIIKGIAGFYYVHDGHSKIYECKAKGVFRNRHIKPLVGDNVVFTVLDESGLTGNIDEVLERRNQLVRPAVANVDQALVVFSVTHPKPNLNLLDRFLVMMQAQEIPVSICFNKSDLDDGKAIEDYRNIYTRAGYPVYFSSASTAAGLAQLQDILRGKTTVLAGPSGVGKSSLTNLIQPMAAMEIGKISEKIQRGKHTTRHAELFYVESPPRFTQGKSVESPPRFDQGKSVETDTYLMDTPGFSSMYMEDVEAAELKDFFPEFAEFTAACKFLGCVHIGETVCGVKAAVADGRISASRYENYKLLYQELKDKRRY